MAYIRLPGGIKVALEYEAFGKVVVNVYHVTSDVPITTIQLFAITDAFQDWWEFTMSTQFSEDVSLTAVTALNLDEENGEKVELPISPPVPGGQAFPGLPNNVALVGSLRTAQTGRSFRGRNYWPGIDENSAEGNEVSTGRAAGVLAGYSDLDTELAAIDCQLVVASFISLGAPRAVGIATLVDSVVVNTRLDTQRRRLPR